MARARPLGLRRRAVAGGRALLLERLPHAARAPRLRVEALARGRGEGRAEEPAPRVQRRVRRLPPVRGRRRPALRGLERVRPPQPPLSQGVHRRGGSLHPPPPRRQRLHGLRHAEQVPVRRAPGRGAGVHRLREPRARGRRGVPRPGRRGVAPDPRAEPVPADPGVPREPRARRRHGVQRRPSSSTRSARRTPGWPWSSPTSWTRRATPRACGR